MFINLLSTQKWLENQSAIPPLISRTSHLPRGRCGEPTILPIVDHLLKGNHGGSTFFCQVNYRTRYDKIKHQASPENPVPICPNPMAYGSVWKTPVSSPVSRLMMRMVVPPQMDESWSDDAGKHHGNDTWWKMITYFEWCPSHPHPSPSPYLLDICGTTNITSSFFGLFSPPPDAKSWLQTSTDFCYPMKKCSSRRPSLANSPSNVPVPRCCSHSSCPRRHLGWKGHKWPQVVCRPQRQGRCVPWGANEPRKNLQFKTCCSSLVTSFQRVDCRVLNFGILLKLVGGFNPSEKYESQLGWLFPIYAKTKKCSKTPTRKCPKLSFSLYPPSSKHQTGTYDIHIPSHGSRVPESHGSAGWII